MKKFVYLAGPISGQSDAQANDWRDHLTASLAPHGLVGVSPLRCEPAQHDGFYRGVYDDPLFGTADAIFSKNMLDVQTCDAMVAYMPTRIGTGQHPSLGTISEIGWAFMLRKPIILVSDDPAVRDHPVIQKQVGWRLARIEQAFDLLVGLFSVYTGE